jgi:hypothetical protein
MVKKYDHANNREIAEWQYDEVMKWLFESYQISGTFMWNIAHKSGEGKAGNRHQALGKYICISGLVKVWVSPLSSLQSFNTNVGF